MQTISIKYTEELMQVINSCDVCYLAMIDTSNKPYVLPFNFGFENNTIYLHSAPEGKKIDALRQNPDVCVAFSTGHELYHQHEQVACSYGMKFKSVIIRGKVDFIEDYESKINALDIIMHHYTDRKFTYNAPAVNNVRVYSVLIEEITGRKRE